MSKPLPPPAMIHPDHLLDQARRGALPPEQWQQLGAHLAACAGCAWEQAAHDDFAREQASLPDLDASHLDALVGGTLARAGLSSGETPRPVKPRPRPLRRWFAAAMLAAAVLAALTLPSRDASHAEPSIAATDANLDAGALGPPSGGDS